MWFVFLDNPPHDDLSLTMLDMTMYTLLKTHVINAVLLKSKHMKPEMFSWPINVTLTEKMPENVNLIYITGKTGLIKCDPVTKSVTDKTGDLYFLFQKDSEPVEYIDTIDTKTPHNRAMIRESVFKPSRFKSDPSYMFYSLIDLDQDVYEDGVAFNSRGYAYKSVSFDKMHFRYVTRHSGLFVKKQWDERIPKIMYTQDPDEWKRVLPADWEILPYPPGNGLSHQVSVLENGGIIVPPRTIPTSLLPYELLSSPIMCFFTEVYDIDTSVLGLCQETAQILKTMIAREETWDDIKQYILSTTIIFPHSYRSIFKTIELEPEIEPDVKIPERTLRVDHSAVENQLSIDPRDLVMM